MSKILKRPMFRKGGSTNEGIVSMAVPRGKYANSNIEDLMKQYPDMADTIKTGEGRAALISAFAGKGRSQQDSLSDLLIQGGLNLMSARPRGNIFATAAESFKEPTSQYLKEGQVENAFQRQARLQGITSAIGSEDAMRLAKLKGSDQYLKGRTPADEINYIAFKISEKYKDDITLSQAKNIAKVQYIKDRDILKDQPELKKYFDALDPSQEFIDTSGFEQTTEGFLFPPPPRGPIQGKTAQSPYKSGKTYFDPTTNVIYKYEDKVLKPVTPPLNNLFR